LTTSIDPASNIVLILMDMVILSWPAVEGGAG